MFVDEVSLTGENVPIAKFALKQSTKIEDKSNEKNTTATAA